MGYMRRIEAVATPVVTSGSAYAATNTIGGLLTFSAPGMGDRMVLDKVVIIDKSNQKAAIDLVLFGQSFAATADKTAVNLSAADAANIQAHINIIAADYATLSVAGAGLATATHPFSGGGLGILVTDLNNMKIYGQLISRGTPTYQTTGDIVVKLGLQVWVE
jgi:hypothetical protein